MAVFEIDWERFAPQRAIVGGLIMAVASQLLMYSLGQIAGISGIFRNAIRGTLGWQTSFVAGLLLAGTWTSVSVHALDNGTTESYYGAAVKPDSIVPTKMNVALAALLMGYGATQANGCTSGHGVCGIGRASPRSTAAVGVFMLAGMVSSTFVRYVRNYFGGSGFTAKLASMFYMKASDDPYWTLDTDARLHSTLTAPWALQLALFLGYWIVLVWYLQYKLKSLYDIPFLARIRDLVFHRSAGRRASLAAGISNGLAMVDEDKRDKEPLDPRYESKVADIGEEETISSEDVTAAVNGDSPSGRTRQRKQAIAVAPPSPMSELRRSPAELATLINQHLISAAIGFLFGYGLAFSGMGSPERVQSFLDPLGMGSKWDITLVFVMGGAVLPNLFAFRALRDSNLTVQILHGPHGHPVPFNQAIKYGPVEANMKIDKSLLAGSVFFGLAWGALGVCPGPGLVSFATGSYPTSFAVPFIGLGAILKQWTATL